MRAIALLCANVEIDGNFDVDAHKCSIMGIEAAELPCSISQHLLVIGDFSGEEIGRTYRIRVWLEQDGKATGASLEVPAKIVGMAIHGHLRLPMRFQLQGFQNFTLRSGGLHDLVVAFDGVEADRLVFWVDDQPMDFDAFG